jgi:hypothetical protein
MFDNNSQQYEEEIAKLEKERGVDIKFIHPNVIAKKFQ